MYVYNSLLQETKDDYTDIMSDLRKIRAQMFTLLKTNEEQYNAATKTIRHLLKIQHTAINKTIELITETAKILSRAFMLHDPTNSCPSTSIETLEHEITEAKALCERIKVTTTIPAKLKGEIA